MNSFSPHLMHILVLILSFGSLKSLKESSTVEQCREQRAQDNENSLNSLSSFRSFRSDDAALRSNMTTQSLETINSTTFQSLDKLRTAILDLSINKISKIENDTFQSFWNLRVLSLRINNLRRINSTTFGGLMMLEELDLSRNMISDLDRDAFRLMMNLHTIDLSENCMFQMPNYLFFRNVRLINIYLKLNHLVALPILMPGQQFVENFNVSGNQLTNLTSLFQYNNIQSLDLSDNPLDPVEMAAAAKEVVKESDDSSSESGDTGNRNYLGLKYDMGSKYTYIPSSSTRAPPTPSNHRNTFNRRYGNRDRIDFLSDVNFTATSRARANTATESSDYNRNVEFLMDTFRPNRMSEEALESLIKLTMEKKSEDFKATDIIRALNVIANFYRSQNSRTFRDDMEQMKNQNGTFDVASFVQYLRMHLKTESSRMPRNANLKRVRYTPEQLQQLIKATQTNHLEYFTCRNCSLQSLDFLVNFPELKYVDVSFNEIKNVNEEELGRELSNMRYLLISDNEIECLNFTAMLSHWPEFRALIVNNNPKLNCDLVAQMHYKVAHLNKMFKLEVNKCK